LLRRCSGQASNTGVVVHGEALPQWFDGRRRGGTSGGVVPKRGSRTFRQPRLRRVFGVRYRRCGLGQVPARNNGYLRAAQRCLEDSDRKGAEGCEMKDGHVLPPSPLRFVLQ